MKICAFSVFLRFLFLLYGAEAQRWPPVYEPFDSLARLYDRGEGVATTQQQSCYVHQMSAIADKHPGIPALQWRLYYYRAMQLYPTAADSACTLLQQAAGMCKFHKQYAYDHFRMMSRYAILRAMMRNRPLELYKALHNDITFYQHEKDTLELANTYVSLGYLLQSIGEQSRALKYLERAESLFGMQHLEGHFYRNRLNIANALYETEQKEKSLPMLKELLKMPDLRQDTAFRLEVLASLSDYGEDRHIVEEYHTLACAYGNKKNIAAAGVSKANRLLKEGKADSALAYFGQGRQYINAYHNKSISGSVWHGLAQCYYHKQQWDSAAYYLYKDNQIKDSTYRTNLPLQMQRLEDRIAIEKYEAQLQQFVQNTRFHRIIMFLILLLTVLTGAGICYIFYAKRRKAQLMNQQYLLKVESQNRELASHTLMLNEKNQTMDALLDYINKHEEAEGLDKKSIVGLKAKIKVHLSMQNNWQIFKIQFEQVHPDFFSLLKQATPGLSEGELRLCAYILTGMENKQIAQMLSLQANSIKMARYRIRKKIGLPPNASLEDYLRSI